MKNKEVNDFLKLKFSGDNKLWSKIISAELNMIYVYQI